MADDKSNECLFLICDFLLKDLTSLYLKAFVGEEGLKGNFLEKMGKQMQGDSSSTSIPQAQGHPRWMWGILHVLKYHHWHWRFIKKRLPHKKHDAGAENPGDELQASNADDSSKYRKAEVAKSKVEGKKRLPSPATKSSVKSRLKALITEEMSKRKGRGWHHRSSTYPARLALTKTDSNHHIEAQIDDFLPGIALIDGSSRVADKNKETCSESNSSEDHVSPNSSEEPSTIDENDDENGTTMFSGNDSIESVIFSQEDLNEKMQDFLKQKSTTSKEVTKEDNSGYESKYLMDAMDIIKMNKGFLLTVLQDPDSPLAHHFHKQLAIGAKMGITRSETFPSPHSSSKRGSEPCGQKQKHDGTRFEAKRKESETCFHGETSPDHESEEDLYRRSVQLIAADQRAEMAAISSSGSCSSHHLKQSGENQVAKRRFRNLRQNIKQAIKERKKERHRIAMDAILHKIPHKKGFSKDLTKDIIDHFKDPSRIRKFFSASSTSKRNMLHERTSSFNKSMDRYTQLYESSFNRDAKEHISKRMQERREEPIVSPRRSAPRSMGRVLSSPELCSSLSEDSDAFSLDMPNTIANSTLSSSSLTDQKILDLLEALDYSSQLDILERSDSEENLIDIREAFSVSSDHQLASNSSVNSEAIAQVGKTGDEPSSIPMLNFNFEGQSASPAEISKVQDLELMQSFDLPKDELDFLASAQHEFRDTTEVSEGIVEFVKVEALKHKNEYTYVRDVLELSGFSGSETLGAWYADDQPLDPLMYEEIRGCIFCDPNRSMDEEVGYCNHPLLFDLINEVLMEIYERSYSYCPRMLSPLCHIRPMPVGRHVLKQVWENISWYLSYKTGYDKPLDYVASRDLTRNDGWMNLQFENECLGLELEELIFEDLLDEIFDVDQVHSY